MRRKKTNPPAELYPGHRQELAKKIARDDALAAAGRVPLPGPLLAAFTAAELEACGVKFLPVVHVHHLLLQQIKSPFLANLVESGKPEARRKVHQSTAIEVFEFIYLFRTPPRQARAELDRGREHFRECATQAIGDRFHHEAVVRLARAAIEHYLSSWNTVLEFQSAQSEAPGTVFTNPPPAPATGPGGGQNTWAA